MAEHHHDHAKDGAVHVHIGSVKLYIVIFSLLVAFTGTTMAAYQFHLGAMNLVVAVIIATIKATLVVLYFMHMKEETQFNALIFISALLFGGVFLAYTINDTGTRAQVDPYSSGWIDPATGGRAAGGPVDATGKPLLVGYDIDDAVQQARHSKSGGEGAADEAAATEGSAGAGAATQPNPNPVQNQAQGAASDAGTSIGPGPAEDRPATTPANEPAQGAGLPPERAVPQPTPSPM